MNRHDPFPNFKLHRPVGREKVKVYTDSQIPEGGYLRMQDEAVDGDMEDSARPTVALDALEAVGALDVVEERKVRSGQVR